MCAASASVLASGHNCIDQPLRRTNEYSPKRVVLHTSTIKYVHLVRRINYLSLGQTETEISSTDF